jgi:hypothetical protein
MPKFSDLGDLEENKRIEIIGTTAMQKHQVVGFIVESKIGKAERYIEKLTAKFPGIKIMYKGAGPTKGTTLVKVGPPVENN